MSRACLDSKVARRLQELAVDSVLKKPRWTGMHFRNVRLGEPSGEQG